MKGHMQDGKFHPHTDYKKTRKKRLDYNDPELIQNAGVKIIKDDNGKHIRMKRVDAEEGDTKKHISPKLIQAIDNLSRTLDRGSGGLKGTRYNGSMAYWSELKFRADDVSALIHEENVENEMVGAVPQDVIDELRLKRDSTGNKVELLTRQDVKDQVLNVLKHKNGLTGTDIQEEIESKGFIFNPETRLSVRKVLLKLEEEGKGSFDDRTFTLEKMR